MNIELDELKKTTKKIGKLLSVYDDKPLAEQLNLKIALLSYHMTILIDGYIIDSELQEKLGTVDNICESIKKLLTRKNDERNGE